MTTRDDRHPVRRGFTLVELMMVVAIVAILAAIGIPQVYKFQLKAKRAEVSVNVEALRDAYIAYNVSTAGFIPDTYVPSGSIGKTKRAWPTSSNYDQLGWRPDGDVYGSYGTQMMGSAPCDSTVVSNAYVQGTCDVDDDNVNYQYTCCLFSATVWEAGTYCTELSSNPLAY
jgi:prepilin-type N-terminal cleavage/methylation domain-containing protein